MATTSRLDRCLATTSAQCGFAHHWYAGRRQRHEQPSEQYRSIAASIPLSQIKNNHLQNASENEFWLASLALLVLRFALFSVTHDVAHQRLFWLLLGAFLATPGKPGAVQSG